MTQTSPPLPKQINCYRREDDGALMVETSIGFVALREAYKFKIIPLSFARAFPLSLDSDDTRLLFKQ